MAKGSVRSNGRAGREEQGNESVALREAAANIALKQAIVLPGIPDADCPEDEPASFQCDPASAATCRRVPDRWRRILPFLAIALVALFGLYWHTLASMVAIWWRNDTFAHGFLIFPIALYLLWRRRRVVAALTPRPQPWGLLLLAMLGLGWLLAGVAGVATLEQLAMVAMIPALVLILCGGPVVNGLLFPLAFLFFTVPIGLSLIAPLIDFTADFTVGALRLTGLSVYREGSHFSISSGEWEVEDACSGVRYLIASVILGSLYASLNYRSLWRRLLFMVLAVIVPIIANGLRAYLIVMIAHLSDMQLALGIDHFIYGWVFFGLVMLLLFWAGTFWMERGSGSEILPLISAGDQPSLQRHPLMLIVATTLTAVLAMALGPAGAAHLASRVEDAASVTLQAPEGRAGWQEEDSSTLKWRPHYFAADDSILKVYRKGAHRVGLYIAYYPGRRLSSELTNSQNVAIVPAYPVWEQVDQKKIPIRLPQGAARVYETRLVYQTRRLRLWHWDWIRGRHTSNPYGARLWEAYDAFFRGHAASAGIVIFGADGETVGETEVLQDFVHDMLPAIERVLDQARSDGDAQNLMPERQVDVRPR